MDDNEGAGADGQDDGSQAGSGAPAGGSSKDGSENDDKPITAKQLKAALESQKRHYEGRLEGQRAEFEALKAGVGGRKEDPVPEAPKRYTRAELKAAVDAGQINSDQSEEIWAKQVTEQAGEEAERRALAAVSVRSTKERVDADLTKYKRLAPEIMDESSDVRRRIREEFTALAETGMPSRGPQALATELAAIRAVLGPLDKLETARTARRHQESDEQSGGGEGRKSSGKTAWDRLDARQKAYYEKGIQAGRYKDKAAVEAELAFARS